MDALEVRRFLLALEPASTLMFGNRLGDADYPSDESAGPAVRAQDLRPCHVSEGSLDRQAGGENSPPNRVGTRRGTQVGTVAWSDHDGQSNLRVRVAFFSDS
jgi:hypothetical protein